MRQVVLCDGRAWLEDVPEPSPEPGWVVVRVRSSPICGSDLGAFFGKEESRNAGHEGTGEVVAVAKSSRLKEGDRVVLSPLSGCGRCERCRRGDYIYCRNKPPSYTHFADYVKIQDFICIPLPDDISYDLGALVGCALCPAFDVLKRMGLSPYDTLLVTGLGPVGLGAVALGAFTGARVVGVDPEPWRRERAIQVGAQEALDGNEADLLGRILDMTDGEGVSCAVDCSGNPRAERLCLDAVGVRGRVGIVGENHRGLRVVPSPDFIRKGVTLYGAWHFNLNDAPKLFNFLRRFPRAELLISHTFPLDRVQEAFKTFVSRKAAKVLLKP